ELLVARLLIPDGGKKRFMSVEELKLLITAAATTAHRGNSRQVQNIT
ncbi:hypothetical protein chiPu_0027518, partial [Chiloscyllium punctatum]|nr:hypothetical protein [Chiloscyllium punctatum]